VGGRAQAGELLGELGVLAGIRGHARLGEALFDLRGAIREDLDLRQQFGHGETGRGRQEFIDARNSSFVSLILIFSSRNSIESTGFSGASTLRRMYMPVQRRLREQELFAARCRAVDVDRWIAASVGELAVEHDLAVPGALELLEDNLVHARAGLDQRGADDREAAALLEVARAPKKRFGLCSAFESTPPERILPECGATGVVGAREPRDRIEQDHHVARCSTSRRALSITMSATCTWRVGRLVERRRDHLGAHVALHVGDLLGALVDQEHDQVRLGVVLRDRVRRSP
jgi:hypothetical protein